MVIKKFMAVTNVTPEISYTKDGSVGTVHPIPFSLLQATDLVMYVDGVLSTDGFTVGGTLPNAATVVTTLDYTDGTVVTFVRVVEYAQETDFNDGERIPGQRIEDALDNIVMQTQQLDAAIDRAIISPPGNTFPINTTLGIDSKGDPIARTAAQEVEQLGITTQVNLAVKSAANAAQSAQDAETAAGKLEDQVQQYFSFFAAPRTRDKINRIEQGNSPDNLTVLVIGDSMTQAEQNGLAHLFMNRVRSEIGEAGSGFEEFQYIAEDPALVTIPDNLTPRREDVFGTGITKEFRNGAVVSVGPQLAGAPGETAPYEMDTIKVFYAAEDGAGTFEVFTSNSGTDTPDDAIFPGSWTSRGTFDADNSGSLAGAVATISVPEDAYCVKIRVNSGTVDVVGCVFLNSANRGIIRLNTGRGGTDLDAHWIQQDSGVLNTFLADIDPDLVLTHFSFSDEDDVSKFETYDDQVKTAAPNADRIVIGEHEQELNDPKIALHEPYVTDQVAAEKRLEYFPTSDIIDFATADALGWASDPTHLDDAWPSVSTIFMGAFGFSPAPPLRWKVTESTGALRRYELTGVDTFKTQVFSTPLADDKNGIQRIEWYDQNGDVSYWDLIKNTTGQLQIFRSINGSNDEVLKFNTDSRAYFGSESGSITARFDARVRVHEGSAAAAAIGASHNNSTGMVWEGWNHNSDSPLLTSSITAGGAALFQLLNLAAVPTFADEAAASSLSTGDVYKTATGELRIKL
jgi:hypothetical protein